MRRFVILLAIGLTGVASLALIPFERLVDADLPVAAVRALALVQPALLTLTAVAIGCWTAPRVGLSAPLVDALAGGGDTRVVLRRQLPAATIGGIAVALILILYSATAGRVIAAGAGPLADLAPPLATRLLYGGVTEELLTRWGLVSLFAWVAWVAGGRPAVPGRATMATAILLAAGLFAAGHLPVLFLAVPYPTSAMLAAVLLGNLVPGALFGWLYWRRGIEAAMIAHALAHLFAAPFV